ncbi:hypothetical protein OHS33_13195 [Streptomyces sp. NBC_00536]|uniref:hypothetical protein n=1 Tax=Streptomyces sp. NBC_00536 TaxID=2975769 RepID=UPI002E804F6C|nr:hypothetical protein [Streptomyces sp. NBC_00536]WUC79212.1 hypothetical protein OHS33_13195 [Streptomyces sp. NBC_00536]
MRVMLRAHYNIAAANEGIKSGALLKAIDTLLETVQPEASYFGLAEGVRSVWIVFDLQESSQVPALVEDLIMQFEAEVEIAPVMNREDLAKGTAALKAMKG